MRPLSSRCAQTMQGTRNDVHQSVFRDPSKRTNTRPPRSWAEALCSCNRLSAARPSGCAVAQKGKRGMRTSQMQRCSALQPADILVTAQWLHGHLDDDGVAVLDATWFLPSMGRDAEEEFAAERIPGSVRFNIDAVADQSTGFPHMVPSEKVFAAAMDAVPIRQDTTVVVYDRIGNFSAPRAYWTFRVFGHERVAVLDGGLPAWKAAGYDVDASPATHNAAHAIAEAAADPAEHPKYEAILRRDLVKATDDVRAALASGMFQVIDARPAARFQGKAPEPRADVPSGHMPGSISVPFTKLLQGDVPSGLFKQPDELRNELTTAGVDLDRPIICSCGSGATAAVLAHAIALAKATSAESHPDTSAIYDGSWMQWATTAGNAIEDRPETS